MPGSDRRVLQKTATFEDWWASTGGPNQPARPPSKWGARLAWEAGRRSAFEEIGPHMKVQLDTGGADVNYAG